MHEPRRPVGAQQRPWCRVSSWLVSAQWGRAAPSRHGDSHFAPWMGQWAQVWALELRLMALGCLLPGPISSTAPHGSLATCGSRHGRQGRCLWLMCGPSNGKSGEWQAGPH